MQKKRHFCHAALLALWKTWLYDSMLPGDWLSEGSLMTSCGSSIQLQPARCGFAHAKFKIRKFLCYYRILGMGYNDENCSILHEEFITGKCRWLFHKVMICNILVSSATFSRLWNHYFPNLQFVLFCIFHLLPHTIVFLELKSSIPWKAAESSFQHGLLIPHYKTLLYSDDLIKIDITYDTREVVRFSDKGTITMDTRR